VADKGALHQSQHERFKELARELGWTSDDLDPPRALSLVRQTADQRNIATERDADGPVAAAGAGHHWHCRSNRSGKRGPGTQGKRHKPSR